MSFSSHLIGQNLVTYSQTNQSPVKEIELSILAEIIQCLSLTWGIGSPLVSSRPYGEGQIPNQTGLCQNGRRERREGDGYYIDKCVFFQGDTHLYDFLRHIIKFPTSLVPIFLFSFQL